MTESSDVPTSDDQPKDPPADKAWLEVEAVRGGANPTSAQNGVATGDHG
jgi:hypothetical protein